MKPIKSITISMFSALLLIYILSGCKSEQPHQEIKYENDSRQNIVRLSQEELAEFGIELAKAGPGKLKIYVTLPGEIVIPPDNLAHIHPRFPGMVKKVFKHIGDTVKKGQTLAIIEGNESLVEYEIKSLIDGTIVEKHFSLGEVVENSEHGFVVADLSYVWAMLKLYQKDLPYVKVGQKVTISAGLGIPDYPGRIDYISPIIDETTRTAEARIVLKNSKGYWKPGLFVNGQIITSNIKVGIMIPKTALEYYDNRAVVFVQTDEGFVLRSVRIGRTSEIAVEVVSGLNPEEIFVSKGGFTIKAELQKGEFGEGHEH